MKNIDKRMKINEGKYADQNTENWVEQALATALKRGINVDQALRRLNQTWATMKERYLENNPVEVEAVDYRQIISQLGKDHRLVAPIYELNIDAEGRRHLERIDTCLYTKGEIASLYCLTSDLSPEELKHLTVTSIQVATLPQERQETSVVRFTRGRRILR